MCSIFPLFKLTGLFHKRSKSKSVSMMADSSELFSAKATVIHCMKVQVYPPWHYVSSVYPPQLTHDCPPLT